MSKRHPSAKFAEGIITHDSGMICFLSLSRLFQRSDLELVASPFAYGLFDPVAAPAPPALGHAIAAPEIRNAWLGFSEIIAGFLILVCALAGMSRRRNWIQWITATVGVWFLFAPLAFWTTSAAAYAADTLIGMLVVAFAGTGRIA